MKRPTKIILGTNNPHKKEKLRLWQNKCSSWNNERIITWRESIAIANSKKVIFFIEVDGDTGILQKTYDSKQYKKGIWLCTLWSYPQFGRRNFFDLNKEEKKYGEISWWRLRDKTREFLLQYFLD